MIHEGANIHPKSFVHPTAIVYSNVTTNRRTYIGPYCIVGSPAEHPRKESKSHGHVWIGHDTRLEKFVTIDAPLEEDGETWVGSECTLMVGSHVGHDAKIRNKITLSSGCKVAGHSRIESYCTLGLNSATHQFCKMPKGTMLGALSFYKGESTEEWMTWVGNPAKPIKPNTKGREIHGH